MQALSIQLPDGAPLAPRAWASTSTFERAQGWLKRERVDDGEGLLIVPCNSIHTFGMRFAIDVAFLDRRGCVLKLAPQVRPGRLAWGPALGLLLPWRVQALELPAGTLATCGLSVGQTLRIERRDA
jgi:uncharacterized membrane protein (UPF0127 family)